MQRLMVLSASLLCLALTLLIGLQIGLRISQAQDVMWFNEAPGRPGPFVQFQYDLVPPGEIMGRNVDEHFLTAMTADGTLYWVKYMITDGRATGRGSWPSIVDEK